MPNPSHPYVATLYRDRIALCSLSSAQPLELRFSDASIKDLEIVNQSELKNQVKAFVTSHQLHPGDLVLVLSPGVVFEKDLTKVSQAEQATRYQAFLDSVPLSSISHKVFRIQNTEKLIAINRNLYDGLKKAFEAVGFSVSAVIPGFMLGDIGAKDSTTAESCRLIFKKIDFIQANSFLSESDGNFHQKERKFLQKNRLFVIIFAALAVCFAIFSAIFTLRPAPRSKPTTTHYPQPTPLLPTPAEASPSALTVQILNSSGTAGLAAKTQSQLTPLGYTNITLGNATASSTQSFVLFSPRVSPKLRQSLLQLLAISSAQENPTPQFDVIITLGKQTTP